MSHPSAGRRPVKFWGSLILAGPRPVILRRLVGLCLVAAILALAPAAHASPPDQTWITGLYDNADFDDVILFITSSRGPVQPRLGWSPRVGDRVVGLVSPAGTPVQSL